MKNELKELSDQTKDRVREVAKIINIAGPDEEEIPCWIDPKDSRINEAEYCRCFLDKHPLKNVGNCFYDIDGIICSEKLTKEIYDDIKPYVKSSIAGKAGKIVESLKLEALCDSLPKHTDRVHFKNGTYFLDKGFIEEKEFCSNRLPINYNPDAKKPEVWLKFLDELLYPEDIPTLQEYMGYLFIPTTKAQAMLMVIGNGGEGKSRIGLVCRNLLGDNMNVCSLAKLSNDRFCAADQEGKLLMLDDDAKMEALTNTGTIKSIVTMEDKMDLERKKEQSHQGYLYVRIMVFGNGALTALYDKSDGFYRRQIVLQVKEKPADRVDDKNFSDKLALETEGIALWCLEGLKRLCENGFHFTISERTKKNQAELRREDDSIMDFLESEGYIEFDPDAISSTKDLYEAYQLWGSKNLVKIRSESSFSKELKQKSDKLGITYMKNASIDGKSARGYKGVYALHTLKDVPFD